MSCRKRRVREGLCGKGKGYTWKGNDYTYIGMAGRDGEGGKETCRKRERQGKVRLEREEGWKG